MIFVLFLFLFISPADPGPRVPTAPPQWPPSPPPPAPQSSRDRPPSPASTGANLYRTLTPGTRRSEPAPPRQVSRLPVSWAGLSSLSLHLQPGRAGPATTTTPG